MSARVSICSVCIALAIGALRSAAEAQDAGVQVFAKSNGAVAWVETWSAHSLHRSRSAGVVLKDKGWRLATFHGYKHGGGISARLGSVRLVNELNGCRAHAKAIASEFHEGQVIIGSDGTAGPACVSCSPDRRFALVRPSF